MTSFKGVYALSVITKFTHTKSLREGCYTLVPLVMFDVQEQWIESYLRIMREDPP